MRILKISYEFPPIGGGGSRVVDGLARELVAQGHDVDIVTMAFQDLPKFEKLDGINVYRVPCLRKEASICHPHEMVTYLISALPFLRRRLKQAPYDINHTHFIFPDGLLSQAIKRSNDLPFIITAHGSDVPGYNPNRFKYLHKLLTPVWKQVVDTADLIVSPSRTLAKLITRQHPALQAAIVPNGIDIKSYDFSKKKLNRILVVTRTFERKGVQYLLRALDGMHSPKLQVDIIGDGPYLATLKQIANSISTSAEIIFHGWIDNKSGKLTELFEAASIFILPSESENFPIVLLEAMMAGTAIITTEGTGCQEVVEDTALLVPVKDPDAIRQALQRFVDHPDLIRDLGVVARKRVEREFTWSVVASKYISIYEQILSARGVRN